MRLVTSVLAVSAGNDFLHSTFSWLCALGNTESERAELTLLDHQQREQVRAPADAGGEDRGHGQDSQADEQRASAAERTSLVHWIAAPAFEKNVTSVLAAPISIAAAPEMSTPFLRPSILPLWGPYFSNSRFMIPVPRVSDRNSP